MESTGLTDIVAYRVYPIYNWFGVHGAPGFVLDCFIPFLCVKGLGALAKEWHRKVHSLGKSLEGRTAYIKGRLHGVTTRPLDLGS